MQEGTSPERPETPRFVPGFLSSWFPEMKGSVASQPVFDEAMGSPLRTGRNAVISGG